nr:MAG TPA: hypothetical protein [Caudoviricetes sp.]
MTGYCVMIGGWYNYACFILILPWWLFEINSPVSLLPFAGYEAEQY